MSQIGRKLKNVLITKFFIFLSKSGNTKSKIFCSYNLLGHHWYLFWGNGYWPLLIQIENSVWSKFVKYVKLFQTLMHIFDKNNRTTGQNHVTEQYSKSLKNDWTVRTTLFQNFLPKHWNNFFTSYPHMQNHIQYANPKWIQHSEVNKLHSHITICSIFKNKTLSSSNLNNRKTAPNKWNDT